MKSLIQFLVCLLVLVSPIVASARIIGVPGDSPSIQAGIDASTPGDTVLVQPGRYLETIDFKGKDIVLGSLYITTQDTSYISRTIIDGNKMNTVVAFQSGETAAAELCGFTITNGVSQASASSEGNIGGGIFCKNASPYLHHLTVEGNLSKLQGGGMYLEKSNSVIEHCLIRNNQAVMEGGGFCISNGNHRIKKCTINNNLGATGGILCLDSIVELNNTLIHNNSFSRVIDVKNSTFYIINSTITDNSQLDYICLFNYSTAYIVNSIIWNESNTQLYVSNNSKISQSKLYIYYSNLKGGKDGIKIANIDTLYYLYNINNEPIFRLNYSLNRISPCIDTGTAHLYINGQSIVNISESEYKGNAPDMGYTESDYNTTNVGIQMNDISIQTFPNPFNSKTIINYSLGISQRVIISIYSITGQKIISLIDENIVRGNYYTKWDGFDASGKQVASGAYIILFDTPYYSTSKKILFIK